MEEGGWVLEEEEEEGGGVLTRWLSGADRVVRA